MYKYNKIKKIDNRVTREQRKRVTGYQRDRITGGQSNKITE